VTLVLASFSGSYENLDKSQSHSPSVLSQQS